jgi:magnesium transporter
MAAAVFLLAWWRSGIEIGVIVSLSMVGIVILGSLVGMSLPFILRKFGQDPAAASAPLVTSIADILGVLIYLGIASALLGHLGKIG